MVLIAQRSSLTVPDHDQWWSLIDYDAYVPIVIIHHWCVTDVSQKHHWCMVHIAYIILIIIIPHLTYICMRQWNFTKSRSTALLGAVVECISMAAAVNRRFLINKIIILTILYRRNKLKAQGTAAAQHTLMLHSHWMKYFSSYRF